LPHRSFHCRLAADDKFYYLVNVVNGVN
jgi:hypothetical protein